MAGLLERYEAKKKRQDYTVPFLTSYGGYPVVKSSDLGLNEFFSKDGAQVAGMAWGGKTNPPGQGQGEAPSIVVNPHMKEMQDPRAHNALVKLEASRHWMDENGYTPSFKITPAMQKWRQEMFGKVGPAGEAYLNNDDAFRKTLISRHIGGDANVPEVTGELSSEVKKVKSQLESTEKKLSPSLSRRFMDEWRNR